MKKIVSVVVALPDETLICSCEAVTKSIIYHEILENKITTFEGIKKCTNAGTGCGGCVPMVKDLINETMKSQEVFVRNVICEHLNYSRQELFDLVKIKS